MAAMLEMLGGKGTVQGSPESLHEWVAALKHGLPAASALAFKDTLRLTNDELADLLGVSARTILRWAPATRLDLVTGDRLLRTARLFAIATDVLEDEEAAVRWLRSPQNGLGGAVPLALATTDVGARAVETLLGRMEHGVFT